MNLSKFNFNNKKFSLIENTDKGKVTGDTIFEYKQDGKLVTADYQGGTITYGKIIAKIEKDKLNMLYQCMTTEGELKAGKAIAKIKIDPDGKIRLSLDWEWIGGGVGKGRSEYLEN